MLLGAGLPAGHGRASAQLPGLDGKADGSLVDARRQGRRQRADRPVLHRRGRQPARRSTSSPARPPPATATTRPRPRASNLGPESVVDTLADRPGREATAQSLLTQVCARSKAVGELEGVDGGRPYCTADGVGAVLGGLPPRRADRPGHPGGQRQPGLPGHPVRRHLPGGDGRVRQARRGLRRRRRGHPDPRRRARRPGRARRRGHRQRQRPRPAHQPGVRRAAGAARGQGARRRPGGGHAAGRRAHRPAGRSASSASRRSTCSSSTSPSTSGTRCRGHDRPPVRPGRDGRTARRRGQLRVYLGAAPGRRQDVRDARGGPAAGRARHRRGRRLRRDPRPPAHRGACSTAWRWSRAGRCATGAPTFTEMDVDAVLARAPEVALVDELAHTNVPGSPQRQALAGRRGAARRRHRRDLHRQHPAPRVAQRRRRSRSPASRSARPCPTRWSARAEQIELVDMSPEALRRRMAHGNIYRAREGRRGARQLLPGRQPHRAARAGPALGRRQGRRAARPLPRRARHRRHLGDPRAGRRRADRRPGGRHADPPGGPDRRPQPRAPTCSPCT